MAAIGTEEFSLTLVKHVFEIWVTPEVRRRGLANSESDIHKILVELEPGKAAHILLNDEVKLEGTFVAQRDIAEGEPVTLGDIQHLTDLRPIAVGQDSGWLVLIRLGDRIYISFDFRYNKAQVSGILKRAQEFLETAKSAPPAVAVDLAFSAAELAVQCQMMTMQADSGDHRGRARWLATWARNGNVPQAQADLLHNLADLRSSARYGEGKLRLNPSRLPRILKTIEDMIDTAAQSIALQTGS